MPDRLLHNEPDSFLLQQIAAGSEQAFDFLFRKHYRYLCAKAVLLLKDEDLAQEVVQECFVTFWEKRTELTDINSISTFLSFMVRNKAIDTLRKKKSKQKLEETLRNRVEEVSSKNLAITQEFEDRLLEAIFKLPDRCKEAFELSRFDRLTYAEIAIKMTISTKAVEALISRSLKILRGELIDYLPLIYLLFK
jgi:RNA polymerase sigma-70 factor (ECF subfamily)